MIDESKRFGKSRHLVVDFDKNRTGLISFQIHEWSRTVDYDVSKGEIKADKLKGEIAVFSEYKEPKSDQIRKVMIAKYQVSGFRRANLSDSGLVISNLSHEEGEVFIDGNEWEFQAATDSEAVRIPVGHQRFRVRVLHETVESGAVTKVTPFIRIISAERQPDADSPDLIYKPETAGGDW